MNLKKMCPEPGEMDRFSLVPAATATPNKVCAWKISSEFTLTPHLRNEDWRMMAPPPYS